MTEGTAMLVAGFVYFHFRLQLLVVVWLGPGGLRRRMPPGKCACMDRRWLLAKTVV